MDSGEGGEGGYDGFSYGSTTINNFNFYTLPNHHSTIQATPPSSAIERFLWSANNPNNQISHYQQPTLPFSLEQNTGTFYYSPNNMVLNSSCSSSRIHGNNYYHQNECLSWPSNGQLKFSHGQLLNMEQTNCNEHTFILANRGQGLDSNKNGGGSGKNPKIDPSDMIKGRWTEEEDKMLVHLMNKYNSNKSWTLIAKEMGTRAGKQCRARWHNHLRPDIKKEAWSEEEEKLLIESHKKAENRWTEIAKKIPGRSENTIKNHWNGQKRKLNLRKRQKRYKENKTYKPTILDDYIMTYYEKKSASSNSFPTTLSPSMGTNLSHLGNMETDQYDVYDYTDIFDSINDQDHHNASTMLTYHDQDELSHIESVQIGSYVGSSSGTQNPLLYQEQCSRVGGSEKQDFQGNMDMMQDYFDASSSYVDSDFFIIPLEES